MIITDQQSENEKEKTFEYVLNEYNAIWKYYDRLHDERQRILDNYMKMIGIPITLIGFWFGVSDPQKFNFQKVICFMCALIFLICIIGHIYFYIFVKETYNVMYYRNKLRELQEGVRDHFIFSEFQERIIVLKKTSKTRILSVKTAKVWILSIINATITSIPFFMVQAYFSEGKYAIVCILISVIDLILQMGIYFHYIPAEDGGEKFMSSV